MGEIARKLHALLMCMKREQAAGHIADTGGTEESLHDEYQGPCHVAINQGVVFRLNLQQHHNMCHKCFEPGHAITSMHLAKLQCKIQRFDSNPHQLDCVIRDSLAGMHHNQALWHKI